MRTTDYLDAIRSRFSLTSDYQVAKMTGWTRGRISQWRCKNVEFDDEAAILAAQLLDLPPGKVLADIHAARTKEPEVRRVWEGISRAFTAGGTALGAAFLLAFAPMDDAAAAPAGAQNAPTVKIMLNRLRRLLSAPKRWFSTQFPAVLNPPLFRPIPSF